MSMKADYNYSPGTVEPDEAIKKAAEAAGLTVPQYLAIEDLKKKNAALLVEKRKQEEQKRKKEKARRLSITALLVIGALVNGFIAGRSFPDDLSDRVGLRGAVRAQPEDFVVNVESKIFHYPYCQAVSLMLEENKMYVTATHQEVLAMGYWSCEICHS